MPGLALRTQIVPGRRGFQPLVTHTDRTDQMIRDAYAHPEFGRGKTVRALAQRLGWNRTTIYARAARLGLTNAREHGPGPRWTPEEDDLLEQTITYSLNQAAVRFQRHGYARSAGAIRKRRADLGFLPRTHERAAVGLYSGNQLALVMGVQSRIVSGWIHAGLLRATRAAGLQNDEYEIKEKDVREFLIKHVAHINPARCDKYWLFGVLSGNHHAKATAEELP